MFGLRKKILKERILHKKDKIYFLESLRGIAAISVALFHFQTESFLTNNIFIRNSWLMVDFFFVLSGFVIAYNYQSKIKHFRGSTYRSN